MTTPLLGYDTSLPQEVGLYRMLSAQLTLEATKRGIILHQSSGAASFKRFRGFIENIEYSAVFYQHLPFWRQLVWRLLGLLVNQIAVPLMKKYKLYLPAVVSIIICLNLTCDESFLRFFGEGIAFVLF
jgi:hypothetical protein